MTGLDLLDHLLPHASRVSLPCRQSVHVDIAGGGMPVGVEIDFRFRTQHGDSRGRRRVVFDVIGGLSGRQEYHRAFALVGGPHGLFRIQTKAKSAL